jgi:signal transduction histidine kinase
MNATSSPIAPTETARPVILLVDPGPVSDLGSEQQNLTSHIRRKFGNTARLRQADDASSAVKYLQDGSINVVLIDARLSTLEALPIFHRVAEMPRDVAVVVVDWEAESPGTEWIQRGADDFVLGHELSPGRIETILAKVYRTRRLRRDNAHIHEQLRHAGREFDHFVRALSHDMMANFMLLESSFSQLQSELDVGTNTEAEHKFAHTDACLTESKRFLDDLVQLAKTGSVEMEPEQVALKTIVDEVLFEQSEMAANSGLIVDVATQLPAVWCNRQRVKQAVTNLVRNAMKHGCDPANPKISISAKVLPEIGGMSEAAGAGQIDRHPRVLLRIHDNGMGIETRMHKEIFLPGRRLPTAAEEGSGMGLAIVRKIAEHYGGSAWVDRQTPVGTGIIVSFPAVPSSLAVPVNRDNTEDREEPFDQEIPHGRSPAALHQPHSRTKIRH